MQETVIQWAARAKIPLISVSTTDRLNMHAVLQHLCGKETQAVHFNEWGSTEDKASKLFFCSHKSIPQGQSMQELYKMVLGQKTVLVVANFKESPPEFFNAGLLPTPPELIEQMLAKVKDVEFAKSATPMLAGLTLKEVSEVYRLTRARDGDVTAAGISLTRKSIFHGSRGLTLVDSHQELYWPQKDLQDYVQANAHFFLMPTLDPRLRPRGLFLKGLPGCGKTAFAKYIARMWGVPLYRMDTTVEEKWVGSSQENLNAVLQRVSDEAPCVFLMDEVEKLFSSRSNDSTGVTSKMLSQLLWWLQEHRNRVLTVMTCNKFENVPPELYRPGRIDAQIEVQGLALKQAKPFAEKLVGTFKLDLPKGAPDPYDLAVNNALSLYAVDNGEGYDASRLVPHGHLEEAVIEGVKAAIMGVPKAVDPEVLPAE